MLLPTFQELVSARAPQGQSKIIIPPRTLAEVAARKKGVTLANYVESALEASLDEPVDFLRGASIASVADELYDENEALCFLKQLKKYLWALSPKQKRLLDLIHTSPLFCPSFRIYNEALILEHWPELLAVASGSADPSLLPPELFDGIDVEFALMCEAERIALYQKDPAGCTQRTQEYLQRTKRPTQPRPQLRPESRSPRSKPIR